jgi:CheY-like chemotaxis protein
VIKISVQKVKHKILVVDDEVDIVNLTQKFLELENYETITCTSGEAALTILREKHDEIVLVLLDIMMPELSGYDVLKQIKTNNLFKNILVVLFTVRNFPMDIQKAKDLGADGYLPKAISGRKLLDYIKSILNGK